ncbi:hypothetical protein [Pseudomonas sp. SJZ079]|uniref:hypothetical protein n=1 Tax=Pseudomonas sp. SJZ079 TaxID=2572887 RepID=UPI0012DE6AA9|nr:hypothetical protein [Pseudomonas sp. SJZ079]
MKLAHFVLLALLVIAFVLPKLMWWLIGAAFVVAFALLLISGPAYFAGLFLPRPPKR